MTDALSRAQDIFNRIDDGGDIKKQINKNPGLKQLIVEAIKNSPYANTLLTNTGDISVTKNNKKDWLSLFNSKKGAASTGAASLNNSPIIEPNVMQRNPSAQQSNNVVPPVPSGQKSNLLTANQGISFSQNTKPFGFSVPMLGSFTQPSYTAQNPSIKSLIDADYFNPKKTVYTPSIFALNSQKSAKQNNLNKYLTQLQSTNTNKAAQNYIYLQKRGLATWNTQTNKWDLKNNRLINQMNKNSTIKLNKNLNTSNLLMQKSLTGQQIKKYIPKLVQDLVKDNEQYSKVGIGPISTKSLPFYAGRFIDPTTGRMRILPKASSKYLNPYSYDAKLSYLQARVINKWNQYVSAQGQYLNFSAKQKGAWQSKMKQAAINSVKKDPKKIYQQSMKFYTDQYDAFRAFLPVSDTTAIVFGNMNQTQLATYQSYLTTKTQQIQANCKKISKLCQQVGKKIVDAMPGGTPQEVKKKLRVANAYGTYIQKSYEKFKNLYTKLFKGLLPSTLTQKDIQSIEKMKQDTQSLFSKVGTKITQQQLKTVFNSVGKITGVTQLQTALTGLKNSITGGLQRFSNTYIPQKTKKIKKPVKTFVLGPQGIKAINV